MGDVSWFGGGPTTGSHQRSLPSSRKAVELANALRSRVGVDTLAHARAAHGGLLALLERYPGRFRVERIPKHDAVFLVD